MNESSKADVAVLEGTGPQGRRLAFRLAATSGHEVITGSRSADRADDAADEMRARVLGEPNLCGDSNETAASKGDVVILAVPFDGHDEMVSSLAPQLSGKVVVSCVNPLGFDAAGPCGLDVQVGSAAESAAALLPDAAVVGAFHYLSAVALLNAGATLEREDVLVCGDVQEAKEIAMDLAQGVTGRRGVDAGALRLARQLAPPAAVIISINKRYKVHAGIAITGMG